VRDAQQGHAECRAQVADRHRFRQSQFRIGRKIGYMDGPPLGQGPTGHCPTAWGEGLPPQDTVVFGRYRKARRDAENLAVAVHKAAEIGVTQPYRRLAHRIEHRLQIEGRAADDLEHIAGRGLVFERFFEVARAGLQFAEKPRVLNRDDRLVGKGAHQLDLPFGERLNSPTGQRDDTDRLTLAQ